MSDNNQNEEKIESTESTAGDDFLSFKKMVTTSLIKWLYILGMIVVSGLGLFMFVAGSNTLFGGEIFIFTGLVVIIFGNLVWRIMCESWIISFSLHETAVSILEEIRSNSSSENNSN